MKDEPTFKLEIIQCQSCKHFKSSRRAGHADNVKYGRCYSEKANDVLLVEDEDYIFVADESLFGCIHWQKKGVTI